jgi:PleD family two-component response regulator
MLERILLIDGDGREAAVFKTALAEINPRLVFNHAGNKREALSRLSWRRPGQPGIILLGMQAPGMEEYRLLNDIRKNDRHRHIPVIVYSSTYDPQAVDQAVALGALGFFIKPGGYEQLKNQLHIITDAFMRRNGEPA